MELKDILVIVEKTVGDDTANTVNARDLHKGLRVGKDFSNWIKGRIEQCDLVEGVDFVQFAKMGESKSKFLREYHLTISGASRA